MTTSTPMTRPLGLVVGFLLFLTGTQSALAATASGTTISNAATVDYTVGGVNQDDITSNTATFVVDTKVDLTVSTTDAATVKVIPNASAQVLTFSVANTGNATQDFGLAATALAGGVGKFGGTDNFDMSGLAVYVESGATAGYQAAQDTATYIDELTAGSSKTVYVVGSVPGTRVNGDIASYHLTATAKAGGGGGSEGGALTETAGADTAGSVDIVFADGQGTYTAGDVSRDAKHSNQDDYEVQTASLTVTKSSAVISDPFNGTTNPKRIPGAVIEYTVTISNGAGAQTAANIAVSDSMATEITNGTIAFKTDGYAAGKGIRVTAPNINGGAAKDITNAGADDEGDFGSTGANTVTVTGISLGASESATVKFRVTIQ